MSKNTKYYVTLVSLLASVTLSACSSGGGGGASSGGGSTALAGTAATGLPIAGKVVAVDKNGLVFTGTTSASGAYTITVAGGTAPFMLTITGTAGGKLTTLSSVATSAGQTVNITPLTDLIVSTAAGQPGGATLNTLCTPDAAGAVGAACTSALSNATTGTKLADALTAVKTMVAALNTGNVDPLNGVFSADGTGMDAVLDQILVSPATSQGGVATVTLIAVPSASLGSVTMPASAGGTATTAAGTATATDITTSTTAQASLDEIRVCMASLSALYPANLTTAPASSAVGQFIDPSFTLNKTINAATAATVLSTLPTATAGTNNGMAVPGLKFDVAGFSKFDFSQEAGNGTTPYPIAAPAYATSTAWVQLNVSGSTNMGFDNWKLIKGAAYTGCPGGWRLAGNARFEMHMLARISKMAFPTVAYTRSLPMHVPTAVSDAQTIAKIVVRHPALSVYGGSATPVGAATPVTLLAAPAVVAPAVRNSVMGVQDATGFYTSGSDAIRSCQDLASTAATAGAPCYDETKLAPGTIFKYQVFLSGNATATADYSFPFEINTVPLALSFVQANEADLFAQNVTAVPNGVSALNTATSSYATGAVMDGVISFSYTNSTVYGTQTNHCGIGVSDSSGTIVLRAEQNADGLATQQTSCTFNTAGLNSGDLKKPTVAFGGNSSYTNVGNIVLGNQATTSKAY